MGGGVFLKIPQNTQQYLILSPLVYEEEEDEKILFLIIIFGELLIFSPSSRLVIKNKNKYWKFGMHM